MSPSIIGWLVVYTIVGFLIGLTYVTGRGAESDDCIWDYVILLLAGPLWWVFLVFYLFNQVLPELVHRYCLSKATKEVKVKKVSGKFPIWIFIVWVIFRDGTVWKFDKAHVWQQRGTNIVIGTDTILGDIMINDRVAQFDSNIHNGVLCIADVNPLDSGVTVSEKEIHDLTHKP